MNKILWANNIQTIEPAEMMKVVERENKKNDYAEKDKAGALKAAARINSKRERPTTRGRRPTARRNVDSLVMGSIGNHHGLERR